MIRSTRKTWAVLVQWLLALLIVAGLIIWLGPSPDQVVKIADFSVLWMIASFALATGASLITAYRWKLLAQWLGNPSLSFTSYLRAFLVARFVGQFSSALVMDIFGRGLALQLSERSSRYRTTTLSILIERAFDGIIPLLIIGWYWINSTRSNSRPEIVVLIFVGLWGFLSILAFPMGIRLAIYLFAKTAKFVPKLKNSNSESSPPRLEASATNSFTGLKTMQSLTISWISISRMIVVVAQYWAIAATIGIYWEFPVALVSCAVAQLSGMISLTPGGLGIQETGWTGALRWLGQPTHSIVQFIVFQRVAMITMTGLLAAAAHTSAKLFAKRTSTTIA